MKRGVLSFPLSLKEREKVVKYLPLVKKVARQVLISHRLPYTVKELLSYGVIGLIDACKKFDRRRGASFETYARLRIRGAILDGMRAADWLPRSMRKKKKTIWRALSKLRAQHKGRVPIDEICRYLGIDSDRYRNSYLEAQNTFIGSLEEYCLNEEEGKTLLATLPDNKVKDPFSIYEKKELKNTLAKLIDELPSRERMIISLHYYDELSIREIAHILGLSESRTSQLHAKAISKLRKGLRKILNKTVAP